MHTQFNLVGFFARHTRVRVNGPVTEHPIEAITLQADVDVAHVTGSYDWEHKADCEAVKHAKYSPHEKKWMIDWQLVPVEIHEEKAA